MSLLLSATPSVFVDDSIYGRIPLNDDRFYDDDLSWFITGLNVQQELIADYLQPVFMGLDDQYFDDLGWLPILNNWQNENLIIVESTQTQAIAWLLQAGLYDAGHFDSINLDIVLVNSFRRGNVLIPSAAFPRLPRLPIDPYYPHNGDWYGLRRRYYENNRTISIQLNLIKDRLHPALYPDRLDSMNISPFMPINTDYAQQRTIMYDIYRTVSGRINLIVDIIRSLGDTSTNHIAIDPYYPMSDVYAKVRTRMYDIYRNEIIMINKISDYVDFLMGY